MSAQPGRLKSDDPGPTTWLGTTDPYARLHRIEQLDPVADCREISSLFYGDFSSVMLGQQGPSLMAVYASPTMSRIIYHTGELQYNFKKRLVDTMLLHGNMMEHGFDPGPGRDAVRRINEMHKRYPIEAIDFVSQAAESVVWPVMLAERYGWRPVTDIERQGMVEYELLQVRYMNVKNVPETYQGMVEFRERYLDEKCFFEPQNHELSEANLAFYASTVPKPFAPMMTLLLKSITDDRILRACGYTPSDAQTKRVADGIMKAIGQSDPVPDGGPDMMADLAAEVYPDGYKIKQLGTHAKEDEEDEPVRT